MLTLKPLSDSHIHVLAGWFRCEREVVQWGGASLSFPLEADQLRSMLKQPEGAQPAWLSWAAACDDRMVGHAQLGLDWRNGNATLCRVVIAPERRGQGFARSMLLQVIAQAFALPGIERVELHVFDWNRPAVRTYERLGFTSKGVRRACIRVGDERWSLMVMGLLRDEWRQSPCSTGRNPE